MIFTIVFPIVLAMIVLPTFLDTLAHVARYKRHLRENPDSKAVRGDIWKITR